MKESDANKTISRASATQENLGQESDSDGLMPPQFSIKGSSEVGMDTLIQNKESTEGKKKESSVKSSLESEFMNSVDSVNVVNNNELDGALGMTKNRSLFLPSSFDPEKKEDRNTLGHEAAHAAQNHAKGRPPEPNAKSKSGALINNDKGLESDAEQKGSKFAEAMSGEDVSRLVNQKKSAGKDEKSTGQQKPSSKTQKAKSSFSRVALPMHYSNIMVAANCTMQLATIANDIKSRISSLQKPSGWTGVLKDYIPQGSLDLGERFNAGKQKNKNLDASYVNEKNDPNDYKRQHGDSERLENAVDTTKDIAIAGGLQGLHKLALLSEMDRICMFKWMIDYGIKNLGLESATKTLKDLVLEDPKEKLAEMGKGVLLDVLSKKVMDQLMGSDAYSLKSIIKKAGYGSTENFIVAQSHTRNDLKESIQLMASHKRGVHFKRDQYWKTFLEKSREGMQPLQKFIENDSYKYLVVDAEAAYEKNNVIFNSRFVNNFSQQYNLSKKGEISEKSRAGQVVENVGRKIF